MSPAEILKQKELDAQSAFGKPRDIKKYNFSTSEQRAARELQDGIETAQNFVKHTDVLAGYPAGTTVKEAYADVLKNTGVDLPKLMSNWEKASSTTSKLTQPQLNMGRKAGVIPTLKPRDPIVLPEFVPPTRPELPRTLPEKPSPLQWTNKDLVPKSDLSFKGIVNGDTPKLPSFPSQEGTSIPMTGGVGSRVIEPRYAMSLQRFNTQLPESLPDTASHIVSRTERQAVDPNALKTTAYIKSIDNLHRFNQLDQYVEGVTGHKLAPKDKTYMLALNSRGTGTTASHILEENLVDPQGNIIGDSLKSITDKLKDANVSKEFDDYLVNKHAITRMKLGEKVYPDEMAMTPELSLAKVNELEALHPEFKDLSNKLYEFQN